MGDVGPHCLTEPRQLPSSIGLFHLSFIPVLAMMIRFLLISLLVGIISCGPLPSQQEENSDTSSEAIFSLFSQLANAVQKTGEVITKLSENYTEVPEIAEAGERISEAGETLPGEFNDIVQDNFQKLLELLPSVKHNITV